MNRIIFTLIVLFYMTFTTSGQSLTDRQKHLATIAALEAQGDLVRLEPAIIEALNGGITINEIKEAFSQLYAYTGFPRSLNALGVLQKVVDPLLKEEDTILVEKSPLKGDLEGLIGKPWTRPTLWDDAQKALEKGTEVQTALAGQPVTNTFSPQNDYYLKAHLFGDIFASDQLPADDREIVTVAALSAIKGTESQLVFHKAAAVKMGNAQETVDELCSFLSANGLSQTDAAADAQRGDWAQGIPNPYNQFFQGQSYLADVHPANVAEGESTLANYQNVTFEPGCRNNWHIHHGAHQILICVSGRGWYQEWGKPAIALKPGMIIDIPNEVKHWHGAAKDSWFQHLSNVVVIGNDKEWHEWLEPVDDKIYNEIGE